MSSNPLKTNVAESSDKEGGKAVLKACERAVASRTANPFSEGRTHRASFQLFSFSRGELAKSYKKYQESGGHMPSYQNRTGPYSGHRGRDPPKLSRLHDDLGSVQALA